MLFRSDELWKFHHGTFDAVRGDFAAALGRGSPFHSLAAMRHLIRQSIFLLLLPISAYADLGSSQVTQAARLAAPRVSWDATSIVRGDFNGDEKQDAAILGTLKQRVFVAVVLATSSKKLKTEVLSFGIETHATDSLCQLLSTPIQN